MKEKFFYSLICIFLTFSIFYVNERTVADRGRKHYEEAGQIIWEIKTKEKVIALTFDDGPHPKYTAQVLDLLEQYEAKGTFFIVGENAAKNPEIVLRMYEAGHELANHTYTHPYSTSTFKIMKEIKQTNDTIYSITGFSPIFFRPVEGHYTDAMVNEVVKDGFKIVMWSWHQDTEDWKNPGVKKIVNTVLKGTKEGDVVLFHDGGGNRKQTVKALEKILPELQKQGYKFVTISDLLKIQYDNEKEKSKETLF